MLQKKLPYVLFFAPLEVVLNPKELEETQFAYIASKTGHQLQVRDDGSRYFDHPKEAAWIYINEFNGRDPRLIIVILLHDIREDTRLLSAYRISLNFGPDAALDVGSITKLKKGKETTKEYLERVIGQGPWAIAAKLFDRLHNVRSLAGTTKEKRLRQIKETRKYHLRLLIPALAEYDGPWKELRKGIELKINEALELAEKLP